MVLTASLGRSGWVIQSYKPASGQPDGQRLASASKRGDPPLARVRLTLGGNTPRIGHGENDLYAAVVEQVRLLRVLVK